MQRLWTLTSARDIKEGQKKMDRTKGEKAKKKMRKKKSGAEVEREDGREEREI